MTIAMKRNSKETASKEAPEKKIKKEFTDSKFSFNNQGKFKPVNRFGKGNNSNKFTPNKFTKNYGPAKKQFGIKNKTIDRNNRKQGEKFEKKIEQNAPEKKDWNKFKKDKKELKLKRKEQSKSKDLIELTIQAKQIYEKLKCKTTENRVGLAKELHNLLKGGQVYAKMVLAHDTARVVQCLLKTASPNIKTDIAKVLLPSVSQMITSKYSHFCVSAMLKHGSNEIRENVINGLMGHIVKLSSHALSSSIVDTIYITWASNQQKAKMRQEFYSDLYKNDKDVNIKCIADTYKNASHMKNIVLTNVKKHIQHAANKKLVDNCLLHSILADYLTECSEEDRTEIATALSGKLASLASTREGTKAAILCFWYGAAKDRRAALKTMKEHVEKICVHEHGYALILAILNIIDDTKMLKKYILDVIIEKIEPITLSEWGRKVIEWIVLPGDKVYFHPSLTSFLDEGLKYSKKDIEIRRTEILQATQEPFIEGIIKHGTFWLRDGHIGLTTAAILKINKGEKSKEVFDSLATIICNPDWTIKSLDAIHEIKEEVAKIDDEATPTEKKIKKKKNPLEEEKQKDNVEEKEPEVGIENAGLHIVLKKILKNDKERINQDPASTTFSESIVEQLTEQTIQKWTTINRACFLLVNILENASDSVQQKLKDLLMNQKNLLKKQKFSGAKVLLQKL